MSKSPRFAARKDKNQPGMEEFLVETGRPFKSTHRTGFGFHDIFVITRHGIPCIVEAKQEGEELTPLEVEWHAICDEYGVPHGVAHNEEELQALLEYWDGFRLELV